MNHVSAAGFVVSIVMVVLLALLSIPLDIGLWIFTTGLWQTDFWYRGGPPITWWYRWSMLGIMSAIFVGQAVGLVFFTRYVWNTLRKSDSRPDERRDNAPGAGYQINNPLLDRLPTDDV